MIDYKDTECRIEMVLVNTPKEPCKQHLLNIDLFRGRFIAWCITCNAKFILKDCPDEIICELNAFTDAIKKGLK